MMRVMVTGAGALLGQGVIRSLQASSLKDVHVIAIDPNPYSAGLYWAQERRLLPLARAPNFLSELEQILSEARADILIPGTDVELAVLAEARTRLEERFGTKVLVSSPRVVAIADDKYETFRFMQENGFDVPASCLPGDEEDLIARVGFPLVVKPRLGARSIGVQIVNDRTSLTRAIAATERPVIQECVGGDADEYTASGLYFEGACRASVVMRRDLRDGNTYRAYVEEFSELNELVRRWVEALKPHGPANFQFRLDRSGRAKTFEINARFSGTTPLRAHAGFNEVEMSVRHLVHGESIAQPCVRRMVILRHWSETIVSPEQVAARR